MQWMAPLEALWQRPQHVDWDGVGYDISIIERSDGFFQAAWNCLGCCEEGVLVPIGATPDEVLLLAQIGIRVHHRLIHGDEMLQNGDCCEQ
jgi:hypothetical protein